LIRIFLVEDELIIRRNITENIDWKSEGFTFLGAAPDGELALPQILKLKPDIVLSDIKMPFLDGLELARLVKKDLPGTKIILLTGYKDFDLAKKAINIGVSNYILKPITNEKLLSTLQDITWEIEKEKKNSLLLENYRLQEEEKLSYHKNLFLTKLLVTNGYSLTELIQKGKELQIQLIGTQYSIILIKLAFPTITVLDEQKINLIEDNLPLPPPWIRIKRGSEGLGILCVNYDESTFAQQKAQICAYLDSIDNLSYFAIIGPVVQRLTEISYAYKEANIAFAQRFFIAKTNVFDCYNNIAKENPALNPFPLFEIDSDKIERSTIKKFLQLGLSGEEDEFVKQYLSRFSHPSLLSFDLCHYLMMDTFFCCMSFLTHRGYDKTDLHAVENITISQWQKDNLAKILTDLLQTTLQLRDALALSTHSSIIAKAKEIIAMEFASKDMSLNYVANKIGLSPNYLSTIFSTETEVTFTEYVTTIKMEKAIDLLITTNLRANEIAIEIGYQDPHYFSHLFKKYTGLSAREYRRRKLQ